MYCWKTDLISDKKHDVQAIGEELEKLANRGELTAEKVVEEAKNANSPMHSWFEWDDTVAAQKYREHQARVLIGSIVIYHEPEKKTRAFYVIKEEKSPVYHHITEIRSDDLMKKRLAEQALKEMEVWAKRYEEIADYLGTFYDEVKTALDKTRKAG